MARKDEEGRARTAHAAHVSNVSHAAGGGHAAPGMSRAAIRGANAARGAKAVARQAATQPGDPVRSFIARAAADPNAWGSASVLLEEDDDDMTHPLYVGMKFADYEYREFPKFIPIAGHPDGGKLAENEDEENSLLAGKKLLREPEERARLVAIVDVKGIAGVDKRWNVEKIKKAIVDAGFDPDLDPSR